MLAIGRILRTGAKLLLLDEPTEGLAPVIVQQIGRTIAQLKTEGFTIVLVEQNFRFAATVADRHYVMEQGRVVDMIPNAELDANMDKLHAISASEHECTTTSTGGNSSEELGTLVLASAVGLLMAARGLAPTDVKIGVLNDRSGIYADLSRRRLGRSPPAWRSRISTPRARASTSRSSRPTTRTSPTSPPTSPASGTTRTAST